MRDWSGVVELFCHWGWQKKLVGFVIVGFSNFGLFFLQKKKKNKFFRFSASFLVLYYWDAGFTVGL